MEWKWSASCWGWGVGERGGNFVVWWVSWLDGISLTTVPRGRGLRDISFEYKM